MNINDRVQVGGHEFVRRGDVGTVVALSVSALSHKRTATVRFDNNGGLPGNRDEVEYFASDLTVVNPDVLGLVSDKIKSTEKRLDALYAQIGLATVEGRDASDLIQQALVLTARVEALDEVASLF